MNFIYSVTKTNHLFLLSWLVQMLRCAHTIIIKQVLPKHFLYLFDMFSTRWPLPALSFFCSTVTAAYFMSAHFSNSWFNQPDNNNCKKSLLQNKYVKGGANKNCICLIIFKYMIFMVWKYNYFLMFREIILEGQKCPISIFIFYPAWSGS